MRKILVITNNLHQASYRLRIEALIEPLRRYGLELIPQLRPRQILARRKLMKQAGRYDAVILQRKLLDPSDARILRTYARRIFFDLDDAVMQQQKAVSAMVRWRTQRRFAATMAIADHVIAGNSWLAEQCAYKDRPVTILPTTVDPTHYIVHEHSQADPPRLVWIGSRSTLPYLRELLPTIERAAGIIKNLKLLIIADESLSSDHVEIEFEPWNEKSEAQALASGCIGIAPTPDDAWTIGKCGFKIIQYMASGLPVIASPIGANAQIVLEGQTGYLPQTDENWIAAITRLCNDAQLRQTFGQAAHQRTQQEYSLQRAVQTWANLLIEC